MFGGDVLEKENVPKMHDVRNCRWSHLLGSLRCLYRAWVGPLVVIAQRLCRVGLQQAADCVLLLSQSSASVRIADVDQ